MTTPTLEIHGRCEPAFAGLREAFAGNFAERDEVGASVSLVIDGETVVDLWAGWADAAETRPWAAGTIVNLWSTTKGVTALAASMLADRGLLDFDAPVASYWPEFAQAGKEAIPVKYLLSHQAGLPFVEADLPAGAALDWPVMIQALEQQKPLWEPGTQQGYHAITYGWLVGEVIRRISGKTPGDFVRDEIAQPLGVDFFIGLPAAEDARTAEMIPAPLGPHRAATDPDSFVAKSMVLASPPLAAPVNSRAWRAADLPAANGHGNGRALARIYGMLARGGEIDGVRLLSAEAIDRSVVEQVRSEDLVLGFAARRGLGYILSTPGGRYEWGPNLRTFGHSGAGGSLGFADPDARIGFGYAMNRMSAGLDADTRWQPMIDAVYASLA